MRLIPVAALVIVAACGGPTSPNVTTGLTGVVLRGPISPACPAAVACDAPFSAGFTVARDGTSVARFRSDESGHFTVLLQPGPYAVVPDADAPLISPQSQAKPVTVNASGLTDVRLEFDTGIR